MDCNGAHSKEFVKRRIRNCGITEQRNNSSQLTRVFMAFHVIFLFIWLSTAIGYSDSSIVVRAKLCRLLLQSASFCDWSKSLHYTVLPSPGQLQAQIVATSNELYAAYAIFSMLFPVCMYLAGNSVLSTHILIKISSDEGRGRILLYLSTRVRTCSRHN